MTWWVVRIWQVKRLETMTVVVVSYMYEYKGISEQSGVNYRFVLVWIKGKH